MALADLAWAPTTPTVRFEPSVRAVASVFARDHYHCRYCGRPLVLTALLRLLSRLYPDRLPYHPNWKASETHPAFLVLSATLDHVEPVATGGTTASDNLVCACWTCNRRKGDLALADLGWTMRDPADPAWDGLASRYEDLWVAAGSPPLSTYELEWMRAVR